MLFCFLALVWYCSLVLVFPAARARTRPVFGLLVASSGALSSSFILIQVGPMALPFIVGPHQCSLTHGPEGRPQVEAFRLRLPLAEFFDALLLSLADQRPLFRPDKRCSRKQYGLQS